MTAERSTGAHRSTQACAPFEARFHRYGKKIFCHFSKKKSFRNKNESRLKAHTTKAPKAARNNIRQLGREAEERCRRWWRFPRRASRRVAKKTHVALWRNTLKKRICGNFQLFSVRGVGVGGARRSLFVFTRRNGEKFASSRARVRNQRERRKTQILISSDCRQVSAPRLPSASPHQSSSESSSESLAA